VTFVIGRGARGPSSPAVRRERGLDVLLVTIDTLRADALGCYGNTGVETPWIDRLAGEGARFEQAHAQNVVTLPSHANILSGQYPLRHGVRDNSGFRFPAETATLATMLKAAGYATGAFGKWHNGTQFPYHPNARGFDEYYGFTSGHWGQYFDPELDHNGKEGDFRRAELLGVSELGLVGEPLSLAAGLTEYGLELWDGSLEPGRLAFVGEKGRTLILVPPGRGWLPTGRPAEPHPVDVLLKVGGGRIRRIRLP